MRTALWVLPAALNAHPCCPVPLERVTALQPDVSPVHLCSAPKLTRPQPSYLSRQCGCVCLALLIPFPHVRLSPAAALGSPPVLTRLPAEVHVAVRWSLWGTSPLLAGPLGAL